MSTNTHPPDDLRHAVALVQKSWGAMPYGAAAEFQYIDMSGRQSVPEATPVEILEVIAGNLERLVAVLQGAVKRTDAEAAELTAIKRDLAGFGRILARSLSTDGTPR